MNGFKLGFKALCFTLNRIVIRNMLCSSKMQSRPSSDFSSFSSALKQARKVAVLTGAGVSAESGVPTFRGEGGFWRTYQAQVHDDKLALCQDLATMEAFLKNPSLVWEFYHYRRELVLTKKPNTAHIALAECEERLAKEDKHLVIITQNIDELHKRAGSKNIIELHGTLFKTRCLKCHDIAINTDSPICPALKDKGAPDPDVKHSTIPQSQLPRCKIPSCQGLLRPHVVWFGEGLDPDVQEAAQRELASCDLCLVVGTSAVVYPAALFAPQVAARGVPVAEFNVEPTSNTNKFGFYFEGPCGSTLPKALGTYLGKE